MLKGRLSPFFCIFSDLFGLPRCEWHLNAIWNLVHNYHGVTGGDEEEELLWCRLKLCTQENGCLECKESSVKCCCIKTEHQEVLLVERENLVSLGTVSCQLPLLSLHCGLLPIYLPRLAGKTAACCACLDVGVLSLWLCFRVGLELPLPSLERRRRMGNGKQNVNLGLSSLPDMSIAEMSHTQEINWSFHQTLRHQHFLKVIGGVGAGVDRQRLWMSWLLRHHPISGFGVDSNIQFYYSATAFVILKKLFCFDRTENKASWCSKKC